MNKPECHFVGTTRLKYLVTDPEKIFNCTAYDVFFEAGSRNAWHSHPGGQILIVTAGTGWFQEKGKPARRLQAGDVVEIHPDVVHWHGADPESDFSHIGISTGVDKGPVRWLEPLSEEEYLAAAGRQL